jgi:hypothetical protein
MVLVQEGVLGTQISKESDLVDAGVQGDPAGGGGAVAGFGVDAGGNDEELARTLMKRVYDLRCRESAR